MSKPDRHAHVEKVFNPGKEKGIGRVHSFRIYSFTETAGQGYTLPCLRGFRLYDGCYCGCERRATLIMKMLNDSVVWIIGGGSGIGRAIAVMAAEEGARVWISGRRIGALKETSRIAAKKNKRAGIITLACDAVDPAQVKTA